MTRVAILTFDERVDRRILREAESLSAAGFEVIGVAGPRFGEERDPDPPWMRRMSAQSAAEGVRGSLPHRLWARYGRPLARRHPIFRDIATAARRVLTRGGAYDPTTFFDALIHPAASRVEADVYIAHDLPLLPTAVRCAQQHDAASVYDSHELWAEQEFEPSVKARWSALEREWIGHADAVVAVNRSIGEELAKRYGLDEVSIVHNAEHPIPPEHDRPRLFHERFGLSAAARVVLFQGGYTATRNLESLVEAFRHVADPGIHLVMLGWGEAQYRLERVARRHSLGRRVHFHPKVPQDALLAYTRSADVGIIPYQPVCLNSRYCTPNKLFEFIAAGLPIIATDLPELRRFVAGLDIGVVGDTSTAESIARLIDAFFSDAAQAARFAANMPAAQKSASWAAEADTFVSAVRRALDRHAARRRNDRSSEAVSS